MTSFDLVEDCSAYRTAVCPFNPWSQTLIVKVVATRQQVGNNFLLIDQSAVYRIQSVCVFVKAG